jgi:hypothetical protein
MLLKSDSNQMLESNVSVHSLEVSSYLGFLLYSC